MLTAMLLTLALSASEQAPITVVNELPSIVIRLDAYDLGSPRDIDRINHRIFAAAKAVCDDQGHRGLQELEAVHCVNGAVADGKAQLSRFLMQNRSGLAIAAAIAVTKD